MSVIRIHDHCWGVDVPKEGLELVVEFVWDKWLMARWKTEPTSTRWREYLYYRRHEHPYVDDAYASSVHRGAISVRNMTSLPVSCFAALAKSQISYKWSRRELNTDLDWLAEIEDRLLPLLPPAASETHEAWSRGWQLAFENWRYEQYEIRQANFQHRSRQDRNLRLSS